MSNQLCPCCNDLVDCLLSLPCHPQHQSCRNCLETRREPIGRSIKCQDCREVFGWLDLDLLAVSDGEIPDKQACSPCKEEGTVVQAEFYCVTCQKPVCGGCRKFHDRFFKAEQHNMVTFNEYRKTSDKLLKKFCDVAEHSLSEINGFCSKCKSVMCTKCFGMKCTEQVDHTVTIIENENKRLLLELDAEIAALQERINNNEVSIKQTEDEMETLRVKIEELKVEIDETIAAKLNKFKEILEVRRYNFLQLINGHLKRSAAEVTRYLEGAKGLVSDLQAAKEGLSAVVQFTHPTQLLRIHEEVNVKIGEIRNLNAEVKPDLPYCVPYQTGDDQHKLDMSLPPRSVVSEFLLTAPTPDLEAANEMEPVSATESVTVAGSVNVMESAKGTEVANVMVAAKATEVAKEAESANVTESTNATECEGEIDSINGTERDRDLRRRGDKSELGGNSETERGKDFSERKKPTRRKGKGRIGRSRDNPPHYFGNSHQGGSASGLGVAGKDELGENCKIERGTHGVDDQSSTSRRGGFGFASGDQEGYYLGYQGGYYRGYQGGYAIPYRRSNIRPYRGGDVGILKRYDDGYGRGHYSGYDYSGIGKDHSGDGEAADDIGEVTD